MKIMSFSRSKMNQNLIFRKQTSFQNVICRNFCKSESNALEKFHLKIWHVEKFPLQSGTSCKTFHANFDFQLSNVLVDCSFLLPTINLFK